MRNLLILAFAAVAVTGCVIQPSSNSDGTMASDGTITIDNASSWVITEVFVTAVDSIDWGPNLLRDVLYPDEQLTVSVVCDVYDVLISDENARDCVLYDLDLCFSDSVWTIDDTTLMYCDL